MEPKPTEDPSPLAAMAPSFPLLVYDHGDQPNNSQTVLSVADGSSCTIQIPELRNHRCLETPSGLVLLMHADSLQCSLWNPRTGEKTALPAMDEPLPEQCRCLVSYGVSSPPNWDNDAIPPPDSLVLVYDLTRPELLLCRLGGGGGAAAAASWVRQRYDHMGTYEVPGSDSPPREPAMCAMAVFRGIFFFLQSRDEVGFLVAFADGPEPRLELGGALDAPLPWPAVDAPLQVAVSYLLESAGELFLVCLYFVGCTFERVEEVGAYMFDWTNDKWRKVTDIGDRAFLLGREFFAASCRATENGLKSGCVYFVDDFLGESNDFHIFDLREGTRELAGPKQDIPILSRKPFWLVPVQS